MSTYFLAKIRDLLGHGGGGGGGNVYFCSYFVIAFEHCPEDTSCYVTVLFL